MIRIKDSIFNENEIVYIMEYSEKELQVMFKNNNDIYIEATFEDIEWNYEYSHYIDKDSVKFSDKSIQELEEENKKLKDKVLELSNHLSLYSSEETMLKRLEELEEDLDAEKSTTSNLAGRILKALQYIKSYNLPEDLGNLSECPISVGELNELLKILKGDDGYGNGYYGGGFHITIKNAERKGE